MKSHAAVGDSGDRRTGSRLRARSSCGSACASRGIEATQATLSQRHPRSRARQAAGGRRLPARRRRAGAAGRSGGRAPDGRGRLPPPPRSGRAADRAEDRSRPGAAAGRRDRSRAGWRKSSARLPATTRSSSSAAARRRGRLSKRLEEWRTSKRSGFDGVLTGSAGLTRLETQMKRIVLAYSGGLDTSVAIPWLRREVRRRDHRASRSISGRGSELSDVRERALAVGAVRAHVIDAREEFARDYILPALQAGAIYEDRYPLATALGRPLIAKHLVEIARMEGATAIAHGCTGKDNDQVRPRRRPCARSIRRLKVIAPARMWGMTPRRTRSSTRARATSRSPSRSASPYSIDTNLWGRSIECGVLEDPWTEPPDEIYTLTRSPQDCPDEPAYVEIDFEARRAGARQRHRHAAPRADREPRDDRRRARRRPHRHGREPAGRHQVARDLRSAGGRRAARGAHASSRSW